MPSYLGNGPLYTQINQYLDGVTPGGMPALRDFFARHHVRVDEVVQALEAAGVSDPAATVSWHVSQHPELREWFESTGGGYTRADIDAAVAKKDAEIEALRKDAARYRWLRDRSPSTWMMVVGALPLFKGGDWDAAIDAAMKAQP